MIETRLEARTQERRTVLRNRSFRFLWAAGTISNAGDFVLGIGLPFFVFELTGSTLDTGATLAAFVAPQIVLSSFAGVFVDRWSRKRTMIVADLLLAAGLLPLLLVHSVTELWVVYMVAVLESCLAQFFNPAEGAILPSLVGEDHLVEANALNASGLQGSRLVGSALGGLIVGFLGLLGVSLVDAATFLVSAILLSFLDEPAGAVGGRVVGLATGVARSLRRFAWEWREGLHLSRETRLGRMVLAYAAITSLGEGVFGALVVPFIVGVLRGNGPDFGWFSAIQAVGGIAGGIAVARYGRHWSPAVVLPATSILFGLLDVAIFTYPLFLSGIWPAFLLVGIVGLPAAGVVSVFATLRQTAVPNSHRGRFLGAVGMTSSATLLLGIIVASVLAGPLGVMPVLEVQGIGYVAAGILAWSWLRRPSPGRSTGPGSHHPVPDGARVGSRRLAVVSSAGRPRRPGARRARPHPD